MATTVDEILVRFLGDTSDFDRARVRFGRGLQSLGKTGAVAGAAVSAAFGAIVVGSTRAAAQFEQTTIAFNTLVGDITKSTKLLKDMQEFAKISPFDVGEVEQAGKRLMAMGFAAKEIIPTLKDVGDITAGIGIEGGRFERIIHNLAQVRTQGKLTARELRDFAVNGVPLLDALAKSISGLSPNLMEARAQIHDMIRSAQISDVQVLQAFRSMASEGGKFADLMLKQSKTLLGMLSNIRDSVVITAREIGERFLPPLKMIAKKVLFLLEAFRNLDPAVKRALGVVSAIGMAAGLALTAASTGLMALGMAITFMGPAILAIKATFALMIPAFMSIFNIGGMLAGVFAAILLPFKLLIGMLTATAAQVTGVVAFLTALVSSTMGLGAVITGLFSISGILTGLAALIVLPFKLLVSGLMLVFSPLSATVLLLTALGVSLFGVLDSSKSWSDRFKSMTASALAFSKKVVGFFWNIRTNSAIIIKWLGESWKSIAVAIPKWMWESFKAIVPVFVRNTLVIFKFLFNTLSIIAIKTWKYIWSDAFILAAKKSMLVVASEMTGLMKAVKKTWDTWSFSPLEAWTKIAKKTDSTFKQIEDQYIEMMNNLAQVDLKGFDLGLPELELGLDGIMKPMEGWEALMNDLFDGAIDGVETLDSKLQALQRFFSKSKFDITNVGQDFGIYDKITKDTAPAASADDWPKRGSGSAPWLKPLPGQPGYDPGGIGGGMMGGFAGSVLSTDAIIGVTGATADIMDPDYMAASTQVLKTVDSAVEIAKDWFQSAKDYLEKINAGPGPSRTTGMGAIDAGMVSAEARAEAAWEKEKADKAAEAAAWAVGGGDVPTAPAAPAEEVQLTGAAATMAAWQERRRLEAEYQANLHTVGLTAEQKKMMKTPDELYGYSSSMKIENEALENERNKFPPTIGGPDEMNLNDDYIMQGGPFEGMNRDSLRDFDEEKLYKDNEKEIKSMSDDARLTASGIEGDVNVIDTVHEIEKYNEILNDMVEKYFDDLVNANPLKFIEDYNTIPAPGSNPLADQRFHGVNYGDVTPGDEYNPGGGLNSQSGLPTGFGLPGWSPSWDITDWGSGVTAPTLPAVDSSSRLPMNEHDPSLSDYENTVRSQVPDEETYNNANIPAHESVPSAIDTSFLGGLLNFKETFWDEYWRSLAEAVTNREGLSPIGGDLLGEPANFVPRSTGATYRPGNSRRNTTGTPAGIPWVDPGMALEPGGGAGGSSPLPLPRQGSNFEVQGQIQDQQMNSPDVTGPLSSMESSLETLVEQGRENGPSAPNQVETLGIV